MLDFKSLAGQKLIDLLITIIILELVKKVRAYCPERREMCQRFTVFCEMYKNYYILDKTKIIQICSLQEIQNFLFLKNYCKKNNGQIKSLILQHENSINKA